MDRHPGAAEALQGLGVVLVPEDVGRAAGLQRGADAVGADPVLGVAEAGRQLDPVEGALEVVVRGHPGQHQAVRVGQDDADRLAVQLLVQVPEHRIGRPGQVGLQVGVAQVVQLDVVGGDLPLPGPPPGREDGLAHGALVDRLGSEKPISGLCQLIFRRTHRRRSTCHVASPTHFIPGWRVCPTGPGFTRPLQSKPQVPWHCLKLRLPSLTRRRCVGAWTPTVRRPIRTTRRPSIPGASSTSFFTT